MTFAMIFLALGVVSIAAIAGLVSSRRRKAR